mmetsp:Transcript_95010/g.271655  ORF Transcript_95010/g.271655 Transcript_95010/m.271655 type:complete len:92 (-) Transcript_95010:25-300(-)
MDCSNRTPPPFLPPNSLWWSRFNAYLQRTKNTICGRYPIAVLLHTLAAAGDDYEVKFESYAQSSQVTKKTDSSVSYASAVVTSRVARGASS